MFLSPNSSPSLLLICMQCHFLNTRLYSKKPRVLERSVCSTILTIYRGLSGPPQITWPDGKSRFGWKGAANIHSLFNKMSLCYVSSARQDAHSYPGELTACWRKPQLLWFGCPQKIHFQVSSFLWGWELIKWSLWGKLGLNEAVKAGVEVGTLI